MNGENTIEGNAGALVTTSQITEDRKLAVARRRELVRELMHSKLSQTSMLQSLASVGIIADPSTLCRDIKKLEDEEIEANKSVNLVSRQADFRGTVADLFQKSFTLFTHTNRALEKLKCLEFCLKCELVIAEVDGVRGPIDVERLNTKDHMVYVEELLKSSSSESLRDLGGMLQDSAAKWGSRWDPTVVAEAEPLDETVDTDGESGSVVAV